MNTDAFSITVSGVQVQVVRKAIKNLHLGVYPPHGRVRVATPLRLSDDAVRLAIVGKLGWIRRQQAKFAGQSRESRRELVSGESHYFLGRRYRLRVETSPNRSSGVVFRKSVIELHLPAAARTCERERLLHRWYRQQLKAIVPPLLAKWQARLGVDLSEWGIKKMKTRWGTCNAEARRICLNLELAKKPAQCVEYILVHELMHLVERTHSARFVALMDKHMPQWRSRRQELNSAPLAQASWTY